MTLPKSFFSAIENLQQALLVISVSLLVILPLLVAYVPLGQGFYDYIFSLSLWSVFFVMLIRPLADVLPFIPFVRPLVILRKGFGVFSASLIVSLMLSKVIVGGLPYLAHYFTLEAWSLDGYTILATLGDLSAIPLLLTSNKFSKRVLGKNWKRLQKLAYVYFYAGALYEYLAFHIDIALVLVCIVASVTALAFVVKRLPAIVQTV